MNQSYTYMNTQPESVPCPPFIKPQVPHFSRQNAINQASSVHFSHISKNYYDAICKRIRGLGANFTWPRRLTAQQSWPWAEKNGSQCSAQHHAAWKLPCTNTRGGFGSKSGSRPGSGTDKRFWTMTSIRSPEGSRWKRRDCPCFSG